MEVTGPVTGVVGQIFCGGHRFTAKLRDVSSDGVGHELTDGILRMRYLRFSGKTGADESKQV